MAAATQPSTTPRVGGGTPAGEAASIPCHDRQALGELLRDLEPRLTSVALGFTRDRESAKDVVQNAFEKALRHCEQFRGSAKFSTWIHRIVANEALMWLRSERRRARVSVALEDADVFEPEDPSPSPPALLSARQKEEEILRGLAALRPQEREVLTRCVLEGRTYEEYGLEAGLHPAAVKSRAFRARTRLSERVRRTFGPA